MKKMLSAVLALVFALSFPGVATVAASAEKTSVYKFTFESGGDTILKKDGEPVGEIVEWGAPGNHALKYTLDATTRTGNGVHPYIWPNGVDALLAAQGDLAPGETYEWHIDIACDGATDGAYMYPFMLCGGENENYFDRSSFSLSDTFQSYTFVLSSFSAGAPIADQENGGIAFVDELSLEDGCTVYLDNIQLVKIGTWKPVYPPIQPAYADGTPAEEAFHGGDTPTQPTTGIKGDANGDRSIDMKDVLVMRKYIAKMDIAIDWTASDTNGDRSVDMKDVLIVRKFIARLISEFPGEEPLPERTARYLQRQIYHGGDDTAYTLSEYTCDDEGLPIERTTYHADGTQESRLLYEPNGRMAQKTLYNEQGLPAAVVRYRYSEQGELEKESYESTDGLPLYTLEYTYDDFGCCLTETRRAADGEAEYVTEYDYTFGAVTREIRTRADGEIEYRFDYTLDDRGYCVARECTFADSTQNCRYEFTYDDDTGLMIRQSCHYADSTRDRRCDIAYDATASKASETWYNADGEVEYWIEYEYVEYMTEA